MLCIIHFLRMAQHKICIMLSKFPTPWCNDLSLSHYATRKSNSRVLLFGLLPIFITVCKLFFFAKYMKMIFVFCGFFINVFHIHKSEVNICDCNIFFWHVWKGSSLIKWRWHHCTCYEWLGKSAFLGPYVRLSNHNPGLLKSIVGI